MDQTHTKRSVRSKFTSPRTVRGLIEVAMLACLYVVYSVSRLVASDDFSAARGRAKNLLEVEADFRLDVEQWLNELFVSHDWLGLAGSFWYATTHYLVTVAVLVWLYLRRSSTSYVTARRVLVVSTVMGLVFYLTMPTAPPRLVDGYTDVLALHSGPGWWGADASAPQGLGHLTNELAAFPSLHAGWALWVMVVLVMVRAPRWSQLMAAVYALTMAVVIVGTANHWLLDVVAGWGVVLAAFGCVMAWERRSPVITHEEIALARESARISR